MNDNASENTAGDRLAELRDGSRVALRRLTPGDSDRLREHMVRGADTTDQILTGPGEVVAASVLRHDFDRVFDAERGGVMIAACDPSNPWTIVGHAGLAVRHWSKMSHVASVGMLIEAEWRGRGLGGVLMHELLSFARSHDKLLRVELEVLETNTAGRALYERFGFVEEGRKRRSFRQRDGSFVDAMLMAVWVGDESDTRR